MSSTDLIASVSIMEVGTTLSTFLFGISTLQAYSYYLHFNDRLTLKLLAVGVWALELGHAVAMLHNFYTLSVLQYGKYDFVLGKSPASLAIAALLDGLLSFLVSGFFIHRIIKLTRNNLVALLCLFLSTLRLIGYVGLSILGTQDTDVEFIRKRKWIVITSVTIGAVDDILIAGVLVRNLYRRKQKYIDTPSYQRRLLKVLDRLIVETLRTGFVTSVLSLALAISLLAKDNSVIWVAIFVCQARAFSNSLFATLNSRSNVPLPTTVHLSSLQFGPAIKISLANVDGMSSPPTVSSVGRSRAHTLHSIPSRPLASFG